jgi:site-specific recombinase XerC
MNELVLANRAGDWHRLKALVLDSVSSPITRRVYNLGLDEFIAWYGLEPRLGFTKATVSAWRVTLEARGLGSVSINVRITAVRKLAVEAADNGLLAPELAAGIARVKGAKSKGVRVGNWLSIRQAQALLNAPDISTKKGLRDRAMLAVLLGCGLRRSEVAALTLRHIQQRDSRWCIVDLIGKQGRVRTVPMPTWVKGAIDSWTPRSASLKVTFFAQSAAEMMCVGIACRRRSCGNFFSGTPLPAVFLALRPMICEELARSSVGPPAGSLSRSRCSWDTHPCRLLNDTSERSRIWCMHRMMGSS